MIDKLEQIVQERKEEAIRKDFFGKGKTIVEYLGRSRDLTYPEHPKLEGLYK